MSGESTVVTGHIYMVEEMAPWYFFDLKKLIMKEKWSVE